MKAAKQLFFVVRCIEFFKRHHSDLAAAAAKEGWQVSVIALGVRRLTAFPIVRTLARAFRLAITKHDSVFHLVTTIPIILYGLPLRVLNRNIVVAISGFGPPFYSRRLRYRILRHVVFRIYRFLMNGSRSVTIVHNEDDRAMLTHWGVRSKQIKLIRGTGVNHQECIFAPKRELNQPPTILVPAPLLFDKGIVDACRASAFLDIAGIKHRIFFAGGVSPSNPTSLTKGQVVELAAQHPSVRFLGNITESLTQIQACDIVCVPSYREDLPKALVEAFAVGRPVVAYDTKGCRELVVDRKTGLLAPLRDTQALGQALAELLRDQALRDRLIANAQLYFTQHLTTEQVVRETLKIYEAFFVVQSIGVDIPGISTLSSKS